MSVEQNKAALHRIIDDVWNKGNMAIVPDLISANYLYHSPMGMDFKGPEGFVQFVTMSRAAMPDLQMKIDDLVAEGEKIAVRLTFQGTLKGKFGPIEPTGRSINMPMAYFFRYENGKEVEAVPFEDMLTFFQQAGVQPPGQ